MTRKRTHIAVLLLVAAVAACGGLPPEPAGTLPAGTATALANAATPSPIAGVPAAGAVVPQASVDTPGEIPSPQVDAALAPKPGQAVAVVAGGCFWGVEAVFRHTRGVMRAVSGYAGGTADSAQYDLVSLGSTDHAEAVEVTYDPAQITYGQLLRVFFAVAHDPTELNRQGPDVGRQYRSAIFVMDAEQERIARTYIRQLDQSHAFDQSIVTEVATGLTFYPGEDYHQNYAALHPNDMYIRINDAPKVENLRRRFPQLLRVPQPR